MAAGCVSGSGPGAPDASLTANAGLAVITELCDRLGVIGALDAAVGPVKQRDRGFGAGEVLCGIAAAQLAGRTSDRAGPAARRCGGPADHAGAGPGPQVHPGAVAGGRAGRGGGDQPDAVAAAGGAGGGAAGGPVTIDLDTTDVEVYGRKKRGVAYNHQGQRVAPAACGGLGGDRDRAGRGPGGWHR